MGTDVGIRSGGRGKYSIWLGPLERYAFNELKEVINRISTRYSTPAFEPHVTLLGRVTGTEERVLQNAYYLANKIDQCTITLESIGMSEEYLRSLFAIVKKTPEIDKAASMAKEIFRKQDDFEYSPHLSLLYSDMPEAMKNEITAEYNLDKLGEKLGLFTLGRLSVYCTSGKVDNWHKIVDFNLRKPIEEANLIL